MTYFMAYVVLVSAGIAACAMLIDLVLRTRTSATRWVWISALGGVLAVTGAATFVPLPVQETVLPRTRAVNVDGFSAAPVTVQAKWLPRDDTVLRVADRVLPGAWLASSLLLLTAILYGQRRLTIERASSARANVNGREVLLTENVGPAVAGVGRPVVFLPRWVLALDAASQELLLAHEYEHIKRGDTRVLLAGAVAAALMPWNPVVWWLTRRLRLAVEQDCDARVLRRHPDVRRYADLLLMAASRPRVSTRLLAAHFGEHRSDLDRRIQAMTDNKVKWTRTLAAAAVAALLVVVSCEAPRPEPLAPKTKDALPPQVVSPSEVLQEFHVEKPVTLVSGSGVPRYPEILRQAGVEGEVLASFIIDEQGTADPASLKVIRSTHELFSNAVKAALPTMRFAAAEVGGKTVKQLVQQPFTFDLPGIEVRREPLSAKIIAERETDNRRARSISRDLSLGAREGKEEPKIMLRGDRSLTEPVNFAILSSRGEVVARYASDRVPGEVKVDDIAAIEVYKGASCAKMAEACPLIQIRLKEGREAAYRKR